MSEGKAVAVARDYHPETSNERFDAVAREAAALARSTIVPKDYVGNAGNCLIAMDVARNMKLPVLAVMQNLYVVHGRPAWSGSFMIAAVNQSGRFSPLRYRFTGEGDDYGCHCEAWDKSDGEVLVGTKITRRMVKAEGWIKNAKWTSLEEQMFRYRAATFWARTFAPEISMGFHTREEMEDVRESRHDRARNIAAALDAPDEPEVLQAETEDDNYTVDLLDGSGEVV